MTWKSKIQVFDNRRDILIAKDKNQAIDFSTEHFLSIAEQAIDENGHFYVALSGGSTPKAIFEKLSLEQNRLDWQRVSLFWSDERWVALDHKESNYQMAMSHLGNLPLKKKQDLNNYVGDFSILKSI